MTLDEFLSAKLPELREMGGWRVMKDGRVRRCAPEVHQCPLTAAIGRAGVYYSGAAAILGLSDFAADRIASASDGHSVPAVRARLLAGLGLSEPGGER